MKALERNVKFYDLNITASMMVGKAATGVKPAPNLRDILLEAKRLNLISSSAVKLQATGGNITIAVTDLNVGTKTATLLICKTDATEADQVVRNINTQQRTTVAAKKKDDGNAYSAHLCISLVPNQLNRYEFVLEHCSGISSSAVERLMKIIYKILQTNKSAVTIMAHPHSTPSKPKFARIRCKFEISGHPSDDLKKMMQTGKIENIEIVNKLLVGKSWDRFNVTSEKSESISLKYDSSSKQPIDKVIDSLLTHAANAQKEVVRIKFKDQNDKSTTLQFDPPTGNILNEDRCVRSEVISGFTQRLDTSSDKINPQIEQRMVILI